MLSRRLCAFALAGWLLAACAPFSPPDPLPTLAQRLPTLSPAPISVAPTSTATATATPAAAPGPLPPTATRSLPESGVANVRAMQLIAPQKGWMLTERGLWWTNDGGAHWADITPPDVSAISGYATLPIADVGFLDAARGWMVAVQPSPGAAEKALIQAWRTADGGQTWKASPVATLEAAPDYFFGGGLRAEVSFRDDENGSILVALIPSMNTRQPYWYQTQDGGRTWRRRDVPMGGHIHFVGSSTGWLIGGETHWVNDQFLVTRDGGFTWKLEPVRLPAAYGEYVPPQLAKPDISLVAVKLSDGPGLPATTLGFLTWPGVWSTWVVTATLSDPALANLTLGVSVPVAVVNDKNWIVAVSPTQLAVTRDAGQTWQRLTPVGLAADLVMRLSFVTPRDGWALAQSNNGPGQLWATADGGQTWAALQAQAP